MVARSSIYTTLHGINQQPALRRGLSHAPGKICQRREGTLACLVRYELNPPQQAKSADVPHGGQIQQSLKRELKVVSGRSVLIGAGGRDQFLHFQLL